MKDQWSLVQATVCRKCIDGDGRGNCRLPSGERCALQQFLPVVVEIVNNPESDSYDACFRSLRSRVCERCEEQGRDGLCRRRSSLECALDRYYGLVIRVLDEVNAGTIPRAL